MCEGSQKNRLDGNLEDQATKMKIIHTVNTGESLVPDGLGAGQHGLNSHAALYPDSEHIDGETDNGYIEQS